MEYVGRDEHAEFVKRIEAEHHRQNKRIEKLEELTDMYGKLTLSVNDMAHSMKSMLEELKEQSNRLETLESRDGEMWRKATGYVVTAIIGIVVGFIFKNLGM